MLIDIRRATFFDGREVVGPFAVAHVHDAVAGKEHSVAPVTGGHDAVEHVDSAFDGFEQVGRCPYAHEITRLVGRQYFVDDFDHLIHFFRRLSYGQPADGIPVGAQVGDVSGGFAAQLGIDTPLHDREQALAISISRLRAVETGETTIQPPLRQS